MRISGRGRDRCARGGNTHLQRARDFASVARLEQGVAVVDGHLDEYHVRGLGDDPVTDEKREERRSRVTAEGWLLYDSSFDRTLLQPLLHVRPPTALLLRDRSAKITHARSLARAFRPGRAAAACQRSGEARKAAVGRDDALERLVKVRGKRPEVGGDNLAVDAAHRSGRRGRELRRSDSLVLAASGYHGRVFLRALGRPCIQKAGGERRLTRCSLFSWLGRRTGLGRRFRDADGRPRANLRGERCERLWSKRALGGWHDGLRGRCERLR